MLAPMRYKDFVWPHNPRTYAITYERQTAVHKVPMGLYSMQDLGRTCRVLSGTGEFYGPDAYDTFKSLATVFYDVGPGTLIHPIWQISEAYFTELALEIEPREDYVAYRFAFRETYTGYAALSRQSAAAVAPSAQYHQVVPGETLWAIAVRYGVSLDTLLALNPSIADPNQITAGQKVRVA